MSIDTGCVTEKLRGESGLAMSVYGATSRRKFYDSVVRNFERRHHICQSSKKTPCFRGYGSDLIEKSSQGNLGNQYSI